MKKLYILLLSICSLMSYSQAPKLINYQGIARHGSGTPVTSPVKIKFEIFDAIIGGTSVFNEIQTTSTNSLGLFSTQIGKTSVLSLSWDSGPWFLEVSIDTTNTSSSFIIVGRQQLVSVPYALYAENAGSAPDPAITFSNNILNVGSNSVTIPSGPSYVAGPDIAITSGSIINTAPDKTVTLAPAGNVIINGSYPNFTVGAIPQTLGINSNTIFLTNGGGSIVLPSTSNTPNTLITGTGAATVTTSGTNTFNVAVAPVNISGNGATTVGGSYPNFVISSPTFTPPPPTTINGQGIATVTPVSGNNFTVNVPPPTLSYGSNVLTINQGSGSSAVTIPAGITPTITGQGIATVTPVSANNFIVNVAPLNLTTSGSASVSGVYPNININTPLLPPPAWSLSGNVGTNTLTNFIGTTDNVPFNIRVNNQKAGKIDPLQSNTFFGYWAGRDNTSGVQNSAFGINASIGTTTGSGNSVLGAMALQANLSGNNNTAFGLGAGFSSTGSSNVFLGYQAGYNETGSSKLYIANNASSPIIYGDFTNGYVGLGTITPASRLHLLDASAKLILESNGGGASLSSLDLKTISAGTASLYKFNTGRLALASGGAYNMQFLNSLGGSFQFDEGSNTRMYIATGGKVGIGTLSPANLLHVNGGVTITDGTQNLGNVLTSDAAGNASWKPLTILTTIGFNGIVLNTVGTTPTALPSPLGNFTKTSSDTKVEIIVQSHFYVGDLIGTNSVLYEIRVNNIAPASNTGRSNYFIDNNGANSSPNFHSNSITAAFPSLPAGSYTIELYVWAVNAGGTANSVSVDNGNYSASSVIIKEYR